MTVGEDKEFHIMKLHLSLVCVAMVAAAAVAATAQPMNLIADPDFDQPYNWPLDDLGNPVSVPSDQVWTAPPGGQGCVQLADDSDGDPLGFCGAAAQWTVDFRTYMAGDPNEDADSVQFQMDWKRVGSQFMYSNQIRIQVRGVNGDAPTSNSAGVPLGTLGPTGMFGGSEVYTWSFVAATADEWQTSELLTFDVGEDYDYYLLRVAAAINSAGTEPEWDLTSYRLDDVFFGIVGYEEEEPVLFPGDADESGTVDLADLAILATNWNTIGGATWGMGDFTGEGDVDLSDLAILATNWNQSAPLGEAAAALGLPVVPEPATLSLLGLGFAALIRRRR